MSNSHNVQFAYRPGEKVIRSLSFLAEPGKVTALVGPSGGGKSTILNLILRFYEVDGGVIAIDGQNIAAVSRRSLRSQVAYVGQDVFLFRGTVRENIALGRPARPRPRSSRPPERPTRTTSSWLSRAAMTPRSASTARRSPAGSASASRWRAPCSRTRRSSCSTRPRHRSIPNPSGRCSARSSAFAEGRTTIVIAHRLHTVVDADRIFVIEDGMVAESGRHDELLRKGGRYASFYRLQLRDQEPSPPVAHRIASA